MNAEYEVYGTQMNEITRECFYHMTGLGYGEYKSWDNLDDETRTFLVVISELDRDSMIARLQHRFWHVIGFGALEILAESDRTIKAQKRFVNAAIFDRLENIEFDLMADALIKHFSGAFMVKAGLRVTADSATQEVNR